ncbi:MAG TPA: hypothetical protein VH144_03545, partial [Candidatus Saccharimonadales bacterium]|nr:hypothetical protein [Candidatus Saccharimonadales bacterium]
QLVDALRQHGPTHPELYQLLDRLLEVPKAYDPTLKLMTTLILFTLEGTVPEPVKLPRSAPASVSKPPLTIEKLPEPARALKTPVKAEGPTPKVTPQSEPSTGATPMAITPFDVARWKDVLATVRSKNAPLYSIIKQMVASTEKDGNLLVLSSKFALHSHKLDDPKHRRNLLDTIQEVCGGCPELETRIDKSIVIKATPPPPKPAPSSQATTIAGIMGGGEVVDVPKI